QFICYIFFFSSRRRHTISKRDWSSDVCSSDLVEGVLLISPLVAFQQNISTRRNFLASSFGTVAKDAKFDAGITIESLTRNKEVIDDTNNDALMLNKYSYHWYKTILEQMKT